MRKKKVGPGGRRIDEARRTKKRRGGGRRVVEEKEQEEGRMRVEWGGVVNWRRIDVQKRISCCETDSSSRAFCPADLCYSLNQVSRWECSVTFADAYIILSISCCL